MTDSAGPKPTTGAAPHRGRSRPRHATESELARAVRRAEESGELDHLRGKPLDLSDSSEDWFARKMLKERGFTHPLLEQAKEIEETRSQLTELAHTLSRRRQLLTRDDRPVTLQAAERFNLGREESLRRYRDELQRLNSSVLTHNLRSPGILHQRQVNIDEAVQRLADEVPVLIPTTGTPDSQLLSWTQRILRRFRR